jgi:hypothetical protein
MTADARHAVLALNQAFLQKYPQPAQRAVNNLSLDELIELLQAQSSSIILTTVTDVVGFFAFLGIATLLAGML